MLAFLVAQGLRSRYSLRRYRDLSFCAMFSLFSAACGMLSYNNAHTVTFGGYPGLLKRWIVLTAEFYGARFKPHLPMACLTVITAVLALGFLCRATALSGMAFVTESQWWQAESFETEEAL